MTNALQVFTLDLGLTRLVLEISKRAERCLLPSGGTGDHRVLDVVQRCTGAVRETYTDGVSTVVDDNRSSGRFALKHGAGIQFDFLRREAGASGDHRIDVHNNRRAANGVFNAVFHVGDAFNFLDFVADFRGPFLEQFGILREQFDFDGFQRTGQVADHVLEHLDELDVQLRVFVVHLRANVGDDFVNTAVAILFQTYGEVAVIRFRNRREA